MIEFLSLSKKHHQHLIFCRLESGSMSVMEFSTHTQKENEKKDDVNSE